MLNNKPIRNIAPDDYTYGCRSAIQKSIRRGDLDLCKTAFDELWRHKDQRTWLKWRLPILVMEDALPMAGEYGEFFKQPDPTESDYRKFIYRLCIGPKNKDVEAIASARKLPHVFGKLIEHPEFQTYLYWNRKVIKSDPSTVLTPLLKSLRQMEPSDYVMGGIEAFADRVPKGGMIFDRFMLLAAMILIAIRGIDKDAVNAKIKAHADNWKQRVKRDKPLKCDIPWYAFDIHTVAGKIAKSIFIRNRLSKYDGLTEEKFWGMWFNFESAFVPPNIVEYSSCKSIDDKPTIFQSVWTLPLIKYHVAYGNYDAKKTKKIWDLTMRDDIKGAVEWILNKRYENDK